jgi:hypothetical protein
MILFVEFQLRDQGGSRMQSSGGSPKRSVSEGQPIIPPKAKKPYSAPKFKVLRPDQAVAELKAKGLPGDPEVQKLLDLMAERDRRTK